MVRATRRTNSTHLPFFACRTVRTYLDPYYYYYYYYHPWNVHVTCLSSCIHYLGTYVRVYYYYYQNH